MCTLAVSARDLNLRFDTVVNIYKQLKSALAVGHGNDRRRQASRQTTGLIDWSQKHLPHYFRSPPSRMHQWLAARLEQLSKARGIGEGASPIPADRKMADRKIGPVPAKLNLLAPRGAAKSTLASLAFVLKAALEKAESYIWLVSDTKHQACAHLASIKAELAENQSIASHYPAAGVGPTWRANRITLKNGVTIEAFGTGQRIRGQRSREHRPSLIVCDDLQNDNHILSHTQRQRSRDWFHGTLLKAGTPKTHVVNLATALHRDALAMELDRTPGWTSRVFKSIVRWPQNTSLWQQWEMLYTDIAKPDYKAAARRFYEEHRAEMDAGAVLLWPEREDLYALMCMRVEEGRSAFEREKQNSPINPDLCEWPEEYFDERIWFEAWPQDLLVKTMALDPSKGADARRGDYSALVALGVDRSGIIYVEADLARRSTPEVVDSGVEWFRRFRPDVLGVEANQFQDLLAVQFESEFRRQRILAARPLPLENTVPKQVRIRRLGAYLSTHRLRFKTGSPGTKLLVEQLLQFPIADHDDGPDALEMALRPRVRLSGQ